MRDTEKVVELLQRIVMESCPMGIESGNSTVERLASEALAIVQTSELYARPRKKAEHDAPESAS